MKVIEILRLGEKFLKILQEERISIEDARYTALYEDFCGIVGNGGKVTYAVAYLSEKYGISERKVYYLLSKFKRDCNILADV